MESNFNNDMSDTTNNPLVPPAARVAESSAVTDPAPATGSVTPVQAPAISAAEAWCPDCTYFKLRRTPKKRDDSYRY